MGKVILPPAMKAATGAPTIKDEGQYSSLKLPVTVGTYYGIPVKAIEIYIGYENEMGGDVLVLNAFANDVKLALKKQKVTFKKKQGYGAKVISDPENTKFSRIFCDSDAD